LNTRNAYKTNSTPPFLKFKNGFSYFPDLMPFSEDFFNCNNVSVPMNAVCVPNNDPIYNYKCTVDGDFDCLNPSLWAIYNDTLE